MRKEGRKDIMSKWFSLICYVVIDLPARNMNS